MESTLDSVLSEEGQAPAVDLTAQAAETPPDTTAETAAEPTGETTAPPADKQEDPWEKQRKGLEAAALAERQKRQQLEREFEAFKRQHQPQQQPTQPAQDAPPDPAKYQDNPQEYWRLLAQHEARQTLRAELQERDKAQAAERQQMEFQRAAESAVTAGRQKYADFDAVINEGLAPALTPQLQQALVFAGGPDVAYWLGKNPAEALRLSHLPPPLLLVELGELRGSLKRPAAPTPPAPRIPQTLTQVRDARGQFAEPAYAGATPLDAILNRK